MFELDIGVGERVLIVFVVTRITRSGMLPCYQPNMGGQTVTTYNYRGRTAA